MVSGKGSRRIRGGGGFSGMVSGKKSGHLTLS